jgi:tetratricopeptide (TPR) repeat protein
MRRRFTPIAITALCATVLAVPASAQAPSPHPLNPHQIDPHAIIPQPPTKLPFVPKGDKYKDLDFLFGALKAAPDDETAKAVEQRIWAVWGISRSDTTNLLMNRARTAVEKKDLDLAIKLLTAVIKIKPNYVEAWNRRATLYYMKKEYGHSLYDIGEVLKREPRHFGALSGLGLIMQDIGDDKLALDAYRRALAVYPRLQRIPDLVKTLSQRVEGRDI